MAAKENTPAPALIKARVRQHHRYSGQNAGSIVEVDARELRKCSHALISLEDEAREQQEAAEQAKKPTEAQAVYRGLREQALKNRRLVEEATAVRAAQDRRRQADIAKAAQLPASKG
jgi:hypothetical protein